MNDKPILFLIYALIGLLLALSPLLIELVRKAGNVDIQTRAPKKYLAAVTSAVVCIAIFALAPKLAWWQDLYNAPWRELLPVAVVIAVVLCLMSIGFRSRGYWVEVLSVIAFFAAVTWMNFTQLLYGADEVLFTTWHHWSSFIGPAEMVRAGGRVFYDTPMQYGLGPTILLAGACSWGCWAGTYYATGLANIVFAGCILYVAVKLIGKTAPSGTFVVVLAGVFAACLLYTSYPPAIATPAVSPSEGGLRFAPCAMLLAALVHMSDRPWGLARKSTGCLLWGLGFLWSPEAAFQVSFVWWPYYLWQSAAERRSRNTDVVLGILKDIVFLIAVLLLTIFAFIAVYATAYGVLPTRDGVIGYVLYPPGPIPFALTGTFVFFAIVYGVGIVSTGLALRQRDPFARKAVPVILAAFAVSSYYLGRSVDNNLLNVMPFVFLSVLVCYRMPRQKYAAMIATVGIVGIVPAFGWGFFWGPALRGDIAATSGYGSFTFANPDSGAALDRRERPRNPTVSSSDIQTAIEYAWREYAESAVLMAAPLVLVTEHSDPWMAMNTPANFWFLPSASRQAFLRRGMDHMQKSGWVIVQMASDDEVAIGGRELLADIEAVYKRDVSVDFGTYTAIRYLPR